MDIERSILVAEMMRRAMRNWATDVTIDASLLNCLYILIVIIGN
jgi:hypothetical protein